MGNVSTKDLKKTLGRRELYSVSVGQIIGGGIMALTGVGIALTGRSVNIAFVIAALIVICFSIPMIFLTSTVKLRGGQYTQAAEFLGKPFAGMYLIIFIVANIAIAMYAISFAEYMIALIPALNEKVIALLLLTLVFGINLFGVQQAAKVQYILLVVLAAALALFVGFGIFEIQPGYFQQPGFITNGAFGLLSAAALLSFATGGAVQIVSLSAECKRPKRDIPIVIIVSTLCISIVYAFVATVAAGVLPIETVANQPLTLVAEEIMPRTVYVFFVVGGGMFALVTTLNSTVTWVTKPVMQGCVDGWFPKSLATLHPKYNTPYKLIFLFYIVGVVPVILGFDIGLIANLAMLLNYIVVAVLSFGLLSLPKRYPKEWEASPFHVSNIVFKFAVILSVVVCFLQAIIMAAGLGVQGLIGNAILLTFTIIFGLTRAKKVDMEVSIEV